MEHKTLYRTQNEDHFIDSDTVSVIQTVTWNLHPKEVNKKVIISQSKQNNVKYYSDNASISETRAPPP